MNRFYPEKVKRRRIFRVFNKLFRKCGKVLNRDEGIQTSFCFAVKNQRKMLLTFPKDKRFPVGAVAYYDLLSQRRTERDPEIE